jgi:hypothetical protein
MFLYLIARFLIYFAFACLFSLSCKATTLFKKEKKKRKKHTNFYGGGDICQ